MVGHTAVTRAEWVKRMHSMPKGNRKGNCILLGWRLGLVVGRRIDQGVEVSMSGSDFNERGKGCKDARC